MRLVSIALIAVATCFMSNACRADQIVYAMGSLGSEFGTLDLTTGVFNPIGPADTGFYGDITTQPTTGTVYAVDHNMDLIVLNPSTGAIESTVGHLGIHLYGLKFDANGVLYGYNGGSLYQVNPSTASETLNRFVRDQYRCQLWCNLRGQYPLSRGGKCTQSYPLDPLHH